MLLRPYQAGYVTRTLTDPSPEAARDLLESGLTADGLVTAFGRCVVDYEGRASSTLGPGDRHLMLKPDGTALVHTNAEQQPVNWQPPGGEHEINVEADRLVVESLRSNPDETLEVIFRSVTHAGAFSVADEAELRLTGTEADLKERILRTPELVESDFQPRATERQTAVGAIDIYGVDDDGRTVAIELKRRRVGPDAVGQLKRYVDALNRELHTDARVRGILVAPSITDRAHRLLAEEGLEFVALDPGS